MDRRGGAHRDRRCARITAMVRETPLWRTAASVLDGNWAGDHTMPSRSLYPHQWSWDTGFIDIGLALHNPDRGWRDLRSLFEAQWPDGRVPHIVFDPGVDERDYFPGPAFWTVAPWPGGSGRPTSGVTQPPVHAIAAWRLYRRTGFRDVVRHFTFAGDRRPFAVLGRGLPL